MSRHATSEGQKVNLGQDAPVARESAGAVPAESLAAESVREGGAFAQNRTAGESQSFGGGNNNSSNSSSSSHHTRKKSTSVPASHGRQQNAGEGGGSGSGTNTAAAAAAAPSYVDAQFVRDTAGPRGKNLREGGFEGSGPGNSIEAEPGSKDDPARAAVLGFVSGEGGGGRGARQPGGGGGGGGFEEEQPYGALRSETSS
ncbi:uncharacterized protein E0L32_007120 [Thyridium curvatum]|uniref:Uncharacterized protein n=1 Tax=Thyridium curvatum TaxID=1093900 RepID=A0A507B0J8_9PEZI|nr:uncharacterized protein E0L32_007120 [Thyridium curvatum]TPX12234.1 hypothetical protein E0L32_007120 [Thyridium curvatum]